MQIIDINGKIIKISNLQAAIDQAAIFIGYLDTDEHFRDFEEIQKEYWRDILNKLNELSKLN